MASRSTALILLIVAVSVAAPFSITVAAETKTSKERLSSKESDEQRVDNCRVPLERRGSTPRPDCAVETEPSSAAATTKQSGPEPFRSR
jgi:hypothetical protein